MQGHRTRSSVFSSNGSMIPLFSLFLTMYLLILLAQPIHAAGWLGMSIQDHVAEDWSIKGIKVVGVDADGPASKAGLKSGDVILSVDGTPVESTAGLAKATREASSGRPVQMTILRKGEMLNFNLTLTEAPQYLALHQQGLELTEKKNHGQAISAFTKALNLNPKYAEAYKHRGNAFMEKKQYDEAISDYTKYIQIDPKSVQIFHNRGLAYQAKKLYDNAISDYSKAIELDPKAAYIYLDRGSVYSLKKLDDQAIRDYSRAIEFDPKLVPAYELRGNSYLAAKQKALAEVDFKTAAQLSLEKGKEFADKGETEKAIRAFNWGIKHDTEYSSSIYYHRGLVYERKGDYAQAASDYSEAIRRNPSYGEAYQRRGMIYAQKMVDREKAEHDWRKAADLGQGAAVAAAPSRFMCPSPFFGKLLWRGDKPECLEGYALLPGSRFRQNTPWVCARVLKTVLLSKSRIRHLSAPAPGQLVREPLLLTLPQAGLLEILCLVYSGHHRTRNRKSKTMPPPSPYSQAPRTDSEVRRALEK